jgi:pyruvate formate lyase activating enzyme
MTNEIDELKAPIMGINRHRIQSDGRGIRTLVAFYGCPLNCTFCINPACHDKPSNFMTPTEVYDSVKKDDLYFRYSNGGITFGGGEPLLYPTFIKGLCSLCNKWGYAAETSLNIPIENLKLVVDVIDTFIIDIKCITQSKYKSYTGRENHLVTTNLIWLANNIDTTNIIIRIPTIPSITDDTDILRAETWLNNHGIRNIDKFTYIEPTAHLNATQHYKSHGKEICNVLKHIRAEIANNNGLRHSTEECHFRGSCMGTCPKCDVELSTLSTYIHTLERFNYKVDIQ